MRIRDCVCWPPYVMPEPKTLGVEAALKDTVVQVDRRSSPLNFVILTLRRTSGLEYRVPLVIPERLIGIAVRMIEQRKGTITLYQVGTLDM